MRVVPAPKARAGKGAKAVAREKNAKPSSAAPKKPASTKPVRRITAKPQLHLARQTRQAAAPARMEAAPAEPAAPDVQQRADIPPVSGYNLLVDGHFKNQFGTLKQAKATATELKRRFPMLRVEIYDA